MANKEIDMLHGSLVDKILRFALPLAISSVLQQLFNAADVAVVGRFAGRDALAAVGANGAIINLLINLFVGFSVGGNVVISQFLGQKDENNVRKAIHTSIVLALISGVVLFIIGVFLAPVILHAISTPKSIIDLAVTYLRIYFSGMPFIMLYNYESAILRSKGDTRRPLIALVISGIVNVLLNLFFVVVLHMSVAGVAIATVLSNVISSMLLLYFLCREKGAFRLSVRELKLNLPITLRIARIGVPAGLQGMVFSFSNVMIQSALNGLGAVAVAATAAALNYEYIAYFVLSAFGQAAVTFIGQNYGAGNYKRCRRVARNCLLLGMAAELIVTGILLIRAGWFVGIFTTDAEVIRMAVLRLQWILSFELLNVVTEVLSGCLRGMGNSVIPALICMGGICGFRIIWVYTVFQAYRTFSVLMAVYSVSWVITASLMAIAYVLFCKKHCCEKNVVA